MMSNSPPFINSIDNNNNNNNNSNNDDYGGENIDINNFKENTDDLEAQEFENSIDDTQSTSYISHFKNLPTAATTTSRATIFQSQSSFVQTPTPIPKTYSSSNVDTTIDFELPSSATILHSPFTNSTIILVGSVHVHQSSSDEVSEIISKWKPETVFIELCRSRAGLVLNSIDSSKIACYNPQQDKLLQQQQQQQKFVETYEPNQIYNNNSGSNYFNNNRINYNEDDEYDEDEDEEEDVEYSEYNEEEEEEDNNVNINESSDDGDDENEDEDNNRTDTTNQDSSQDETKRIKSKNTNIRKINNQISYNRHHQKLPFNRNISQTSLSSNNNNNTTTTIIESSTTDTDADDEFSKEDDDSTANNTTTPPTPVDHDDSEKAPSFQDIIKTIKEEGLPGLLHVLMAEMIRKAGNQSKVGPGAEFITAFIESKKIGAKIVLGDRLVEITLQRVWNSLTRWEKIKFIFCLCMASFTEVTQQDIDALKNSDDRLVMELLDEFKEKFPSVVQTIVTERDQYMAARLRLCPGKKIVAVVGKGHVNGIIREWNNYQINLTELESPYVKRQQDPTKSSTLWIAKWATLLLIPIASALYLFNKRYWNIAY